MKRETNDRCNVFSVWNRNLLPVCVLLLRAVSGCGSHSPAWRGIDSGYDSQSSQPGDAERSANTADLLSTLTLKLWNTAMKLISLFVLLLAGFLVLGMRTLWWRYSSSSSRPATWQSSGPTVESVRRLADLLTLRVSIADVLVGEGYGYRGVWIVKGDAFFGIDLDEISVPVDLQDEATSDRDDCAASPTAQVRAAQSRFNQDLGRRSGRVVAIAFWRA